jgi:hypothetical protein
MTAGGNSGKTCPGDYIRLFDSGVVIPESNLVCWIFIKTG